MRRVAVGAVAAAMLAVPAVVLAGSAEREFGGKLDRNPDEYIGFDVVKHNGKRYVTDLALIAFFTCADPGENGIQAGTLAGRYRIKDGEFGGDKSYDFDKMRRRGSEGVSYSIEGKFVTNRKVRGEFKMRLRGGDGDPCVTGKLPYVARKPSPTPPPVPIRAR